MERDEGARSSMNGILISLSAFLSHFAKQARSQVTKKFRTESTANTPRLGNTTPRSPLASSKQLLNKANPFAYKKKNSNKDNNHEEKFLDDEGFGDGGLWQRSILMGEKCQPPEFSGVIYYDHNGNQLPELPPRSPRVSPFPSYAYGMARDM
ncbi:Transmembrane protein [Thalictrum thalictroides]|uniref:Transmembrane protein n=1 Tax=Thalictrum thalictroides TaxID=46969 RepID=A0A7J6WCU1_THATH|nr:Transmembrane protein [Thalictrum thalictroides]